MTTWNTEYYSSTHFFKFQTKIGFAEIYHMPLMVYDANTGTAEEGLLCPILLFPPPLFQYESNILNIGGESV